jgi:hypothetical protein
VLKCQGGISDECVPDSSADVGHLREVQSRHLANACIGLPAGNCIHNFCNDWIPSRWALPGSPLSADRQINNTKKGNFEYFVPSILSDVLLFFPTKQMHELLWISAIPSKASFCRTVQTPRILP